MGKHRKYSTKTKIAAVKDYQKGLTVDSIVEKYDLLDGNRLRQWVKTYEQGNTIFEETRGKKTGPSKGRKRKPKSKEEMTKDEYIKYLEMENDILKLIAELENSQFPKNHK
jgi:transposase-like protein